MKQSAMKFDTPPASSASENILKKKTEKRERRDELRREYDLSKLKGGVRGKYVARFEQEQISYSSHRM